ncbi:MAG TPA: type II secretion system minor pseudopilin GspJ [Pseudomonadales bacterium]
MSAWIAPLTARRQDGFTLLEMLVVFSVFAVLGVVASQIVGRVLGNQQILSERGERLAEIQRAMEIIQRDVMQVSSRGVRDQLGDPMDPLMIGADGLMEFTRTGWRNPLGRRRAELQRVTYMMQDGDLYRAYWPVLDRAADTEPNLQQLLRGVEQIEFFAVDLDGNEHSFWPLLDRSDSESGSSLGAIMMRIDLNPFGIVERLWTVPSV